jgi:hypothetical protein
MSGNMRCNLADSCQRYVCPHIELHDSCDHSNCGADICLTFNPTPETVIMASTIVVACIVEHRNEDGVFMQNKRYECVKGFKP